MKIITGSTGTAHVTSNNDREFNQGVFGDGLAVLSNGYQLEAIIKDSNTITIKDGDLVFQGCHALIEPGTTEDVTIQTGTVGKKRNDLIVAHYELDQNTGYEEVTLDVITGEESSSTPSDPEYTQGIIRTGALIAEVPLYRVALNGVNIGGITPLFTARGDLLGQIEQINTDLSDRPYIIEMGISSTLSLPYIRWSNGLQVVYGNWAGFSYANPNVAEQRISFTDKPFVNTDYVVLTNLTTAFNNTSGLDINLKVDNKSTTSFRVFEHSQSGDLSSWVTSHTFNFVAIGRWK